MPEQVVDYADLFEHAPTGYMVLDASGCILRINQTGAAMLGWVAAKLEGRPFSRWVVSGDRQVFADHLEKLRCGTSCLSEELRVRNRQGRFVSLRLESSGEMTACGDPRGCRCVIVDVSGEQRSARKLRRLQSQLAHVARVNTVGELASSLAHELNQPLGTVVLNCEAALHLLDSGSAGDYEFARTLIQAREAASFASDVVRHLRSFLGNSGELRRACSLRDLIQDVSTLIRAGARDDDVLLQLDVDPDLPPVHVDPVQIEQVLLNLAHNSIEAMRENAGVARLITISARLCSSNLIRVSVADTGPGLDAKQINRLFTPFFTTKNNGLGMGLSISRTIVEAHDGQLWAATVPASGAIMHFTLPPILSERPC